MPASFNPARSDPAVPATMGLELPTSILLRPDEVIE